MDILPSGEKEEKQEAYSATCYTGSRTYEETHGVAAWIIVLGNVGGVVMIAVFIIVCCCAMRRRRAEQQRQAQVIVMQYPQAGPVNQPGLPYGEPPPPYSAINAGYEHSHDDKPSGSPVRPNGTTRNPHTVHQGVIMSPQNTQNYRAGPANKQQPVGMQKYLADGYNYGTQI